ADSEREAKVPPTLLEQWMPAFLAQLAAPGAQRWQDAGRPDISTTRLRVTPRSHTYRIGDGPALCWEHRLT
ncbi:methyltransferase, partial [Streptomyces sp. NPDC005970]